MAKSLRSKRKKRLRTLRREMVEPYYDKKDVAKYAALEAALAAPKVPVFAKGKNGEVTVMDDDDSMFKSIPAAVDVATEGFYFYLLFIVVVSLVWNYGRLEVLILVEKMVEQALPEID